MKFNSFNNSYTKNNGENYNFIKYWMGLFLFTCFTFLFPSLTIAQSTFEIQDGSSTYYAIISVEDCDDGYCGGEGTVKLFEKSTKKLFQTFTSEDLSFFLQEDQQPSVNVIQLYNEQSPLIFGDFNFDGSEDLAIRNGNSGPYGSPTYNVYVYNSTRNHFVLSEELTELITESLGMFRLDNEKKEIITFSKSGCCYHETSKYIVVPGKGLKLIYTFEEDATKSGVSIPEGKIALTTSRLKDGKWEVTTRYEDIKKYYGD